MSNLSNSFGTKSKITIDGKSFTYFSLNELEKQGVANVSGLPYSIKILLEAALRNENGLQVTRDDILKFAMYDSNAPTGSEVPIMPARVLLQDFTGVPAVVDLAAMRNAVSRLGGNPDRINPLIPVDLVIDHSVQVDYFNRSDAETLNSEIEFSRNRERYEFLRWGQKAFDNFRVVPPSSGICHQVNLEYLAKVIQRNTFEEGEILFPDSVLGTDSHTPMINGLGVVGWGVGGIEAEAAMLGQPLYMLLPEVIGIKISGELPTGTTATDLVLYITQILRQNKVVGKFVEYFGSGLSNMTVADRATLSNMSPENGSTMGFFPVDDNTLKFMRDTNRSEELISIVEQYCKAQGLFRTDDSKSPNFSKVIEVDLSTIEPSLSGPKRPHDRVSLSNMKSSWQASLTAPVDKLGFAVSDSQVTKSSAIEFPVGHKHDLTHGDVVIAAITSCTNTSNPSVMLGAGLLAKKAVEAGLNVKPYVKTSLAPGSKVVTSYLQRSGLLTYLEQLGFYLVGYGCTTCIGNSGPVPEPIAKAVDENKLIVSAVLSGNRNFTGRINPHTKASYLASPPLVVAYALAGTVNIDLINEPIGKNKEGKAIFLKDIWPTNKEILEVIGLANDPEVFKNEYNNIENSNPEWNDIVSSDSALFNWNEASTYIQEPPYFVGLSKDEPGIHSVVGAKVLIVAGDSITTDHISPAGSIAKDSEAAKYLLENGVDYLDFNSYGSRRGNDRVMTRGTYANIMFKNALVEDKFGAWTKHQPSGELMSLYEASKRYKAEEVPLVVLAGKDYGMGSSRDWAAKGTALLGVKAVIASSFERIHRSNLVGMGVLPLQFKDGEDYNTLNLTGEESFDIRLDENLKPKQMIQVIAHSKDNSKVTTFEVLCRIDTKVEVEYYKNGGILHFVLRNMLFSK